MERLNNSQKHFDLYGWHALKGQKLLAQGSALGIMAIGKAPCKVGCSKSINFSTRFLRRNTS